MSSTNAVTPVVAPVVESTLVSTNVKVTGLSPLIMHCGQAADPFNQFSRAMKKISSKRNKVDDDLIRLDGQKWWAGLYTSEPAVIDDDGNVSIDPKAKLIIPAHVLESCMRVGATKHKLGKAMSAGAIVENDGTFEYEGPKDINKLFLDKRYESRFMAKIGTSKVPTVRPWFHVWSVTWDIQIDTSVIDPEQVYMAIAAAGKLAGIGDWRPGAPHGGHYGRFVIDSMNIVG